MRGRPGDVPATVARVLDAALDRGLALQRPAVLGYLSRLRSRRPDATPAEVVEQLERHYLTTVAGLGAAAGGSAALPGAGTGVSLASGTAEITAFVSATAMYVLALAEIHDIPVDDPQRRRALVLTVLLGPAGPLAIDAGAREPRRAADLLGRRASQERVAGINARLSRLLLTRFGARQTVLLLGRALPLGIGAGVGAAGNAALARAAIGAARRVFGPPPQRDVRAIGRTGPPHPSRRTGRARRDDGPGAGSLG